MRTAARFHSFFCGMPCELTLDVPKSGTVAAVGGCPACRDEIAAFRKEDRPPVVAGRRTALAPAIDAAARILSEARAAFIYGLSRSATATAGRAAALAALVRGVIDVEGSEEIRADLFALQTFGLPTATFGEIRDRADLLLLWRCDPRLTHRHLFEVPPRPALTRAPERAIVVVPAAGHPSARTTDLILPAGPGGDLEAALALRAMAGGASIEGDAAGGVPLAALAEASDRLRRARYSAIFWAPAATAGPSGAAVASTLTLLARDLNREARCVARPLGAGGNVAGAMTALAAATGFPCTVGFGSGAVRFAPGEFGAARMIGERCADTVLYLGARSGGHIKDDTGARGRKRPRRPRLVVVGPRLPAEVSDPDVWIPTALPGLTSAGTALRSDGVTVVLRALLPTRRPTEDEVLDTLTRRVGEEARRR